MTIEDAMTQALLNGHAMSTFAPDPDLTWPTATCRACGLRMFQLGDGMIQGAVLMIPCTVGREIASRRRASTKGDVGTAER